MTASIKVVQIGNSVGVILPKEVAAKLKVAVGDKLSVTETPGGIKLSAYDERHEKVMEVARRVMRKERDVLKKLAE